MPVDANCDLVNKEAGDVAFVQHTRLIAAPGKREELVAKFLESAEIQRDNPDCQLMLVSTAPDSADVVYLTEVWSSEDAWEQARRSADPS